MKVTTLLTGALLSLGLLAAPITEESALEVVSREAEVTANKHQAGELFKRKDVTCQLQGGAKEVNCRAGPGTNYKVVEQLGMWSSWVFSCVKSGECVNIGGKINCGWHYISYIGNNGCYINGHYTDDRCTLASLGRC
ncbi:hypothetical protein VTI74DRAFT_4957 [Chaetomium olivicolor]